MWRTIVSIICGLVAWVVIVSVLNWGLRLLLPGYHQVEATMQFTLGMEVARLVIAAATSLAAGAVTGAIAPASRLAPWIVGLVLVALFVPAHVHLWDRFPLWYHLTFLLTLAPLVTLGAQVTSRKAHPAAT